VPDDSAPPAAPRAVLARICRACLDDLPVDEATVAVASGSAAWAPAYATSRAVGRLEEYAFTVGEGPCVDVLREHAPVVVPDLTRPASAARWPAWTPAALQAGMRSIVALPIQSGAIAAGVLTLYARSPVQLDAPTLARAFRFAAVAFLGLLDVMSGLTDTGADGRDEAEASLLRSEVHRAAGMIMAQADLPIDQALSRLRAYAFASGRPLSEVATDVLTGSVRFAPDRKAAQ
jgi:GAF domain-containing protein